MNINSEPNLKTNWPITHLTQSLLTLSISSEHLNLQMESYKFLNATAMLDTLTSPQNINVCSLHGNPLLDMNTQGRVTSSPPGIPFGLLVCIIWPHATTSVMNLKKCWQWSHYPYSTNSNSVFTRTTSKISCIHFSLLCSVITASLAAAGWSAYCNIMAACMGQWLQGCMTLPWYWGEYLDVKEGNTYPQSY